ncbi:MAG: GNAT family N-acetyltransferase [Acholeplasmataceae bacterium]|jgi:ribosomal protein S18 acetylase RimI-like enzyme|uniref:GNAT family N-acetyltransferase n=1 Tax=Liberiplasma polymorphum TaxID=3374570 RepID=UPI0028535EED|nr:GNAT family N-acetyltransferase [Acholeplasmataceae bacterium]
MEIKKITDYNISELKALYDALEWYSYTKDIEKFAEMFTHSLGVFAAFDDDLLVGLIRVIGDKTHILYIQDILVLPSYQRKGIGKKLLKHVTTIYKDVRQKVLITDADSVSANKFYESVGFKKNTDYKINCYLRFD